MVRNKIVLITGASSGIGKACAEIFAKQGAKLLLCARREDRLQSLAAELTENYATEVRYLAFDIGHAQHIQSLFNALPEEWKAVDILINNAGLGIGLDKIQDGQPEDWDRMIDTNIKGVLYLTHTVLPLMLKRQQGHIINMGSIAGYETYAKGAVYCATKAAVHALNTGIKLDLLGTPIRVTVIAPGLVETEFSQVRFKGDTERATTVYQGLKCLAPEDVADAVLYCASCPPHVNIRELTILPTAQSGAMQVHRE